MVLIFPPVSCDSLDDLCIGIGDFQLGLHSQSTDVHIEDGGFYKKLHPEVWVVTSQSVKSSHRIAKTATDPHL